MDQSPDHRGHVGPEFRGPEFVPWVPASAPPAPPGPPIPPGPPPAGARAMTGPRVVPDGRRPAIITAVAFFLVAAVVAAGTGVAHYSDTHIPAPVTAPQPVPRATPSNLDRPAGVSEDRIDFVTSEGTGQLILLNWSWSETGRLPPSSGAYLHVELELTCSSGVVQYGPDYFQVFDNSGQLLEVATDGTDGPELDIGTLEEGERVRGTISFDLTRGEATLLMSDGLDQTVTALRIPQ